MNTNPTRYKSVVALIAPEAHQRLRQIVASEAGLSVSELVREGLARIIKERYGEDIDFGTGAWGGDRT